MVKTQFCPFRRFECRTCAEIKTKRMITRPNYQMDEDGKLRTKSGLSSVYTKLDASSPSIMQSLDSMTVLERSGSSNEGADMKMSSWNEKQTDTATTLGKEFKSLNLTRNDDITRSFQILDSKEFLQVQISIWYAFI